MYTLLSLVEMTQFFVFCIKSESFLLLLPKICEAFCSEMDRTEICLVVVMQLAMLLLGTEPSATKDCCSDPEMIVQCRGLFSARGEKQRFFPVPQFTKPRCVGITIFSALTRLLYFVQYIYA